MEIVKSDKQQVFGVASMAEIKDLQGDVIATDTLEKAAYDFVVNSREGHHMHESKTVATLIESLFITADKAAVLGLEDSWVGKWWVGFQIHDNDVWKKIKDGHLSMFSIGGVAKSN